MSHLARRVGVFIAASMCGLTVIEACVKTACEEHNCRRATQIVAKGKPEKKEEWAWAMVLGCGADGGLAARDAWMKLRTVTDTSDLEELYGRVWSFRDAALFEAARRSLGDPSATAQSRVYSAMMLVSQLFDNMGPSYTDFISAGPNKVCRVSSVYDRGITTGAALPADARQRVRAAALGVLSSASVPTIVQNAARCIQQTLDIDNRVQASKPIVPPSL